MTYKDALKEFHRLKGIEVRKNARLLGLEGIRHVSRQDYEYIDSTWSEDQCYVIWEILKGNIAQRYWVTCIFCLYKAMTNSTCASCAWANHHGGPCGWVLSEYKFDRKNPVDIIAWETYDKIITKIKRGGK